MRKIITTGHDSPTTDAAIEWLKQRGATVTECDTVAVITLPYTAVIERVSQEIWYYHLTFTDDTSEDYVMVTLDVDARQTDLEYFPTPPEPPEIAAKECHIFKCMLPATQKIMFTSGMSDYYCDQHANTFDREIIEDIETLNK